MATAALRSSRRDLFAELQPISLSNCEFQRLGEAHDGGYIVCGNLLNDVEAAYSYGISGYDQWGCDVSTRFSVTTHEYDCFDIRQPACPGGRLAFHPECVGPTKTTIEGRPFDSVAGHVARNGDSGKRLVMKMDVEGAEWDSLLNTSDDLLGNIDQLIMEFHSVQDPRALPLILKLKRTFDVVHLHFNNFSCDRSAPPFPAWAYEVLFINKRMGIPGPSTSQSATVFDARNDAEAPDCQRLIRRSRWPSSQCGCRHNLASPAALGVNTLIRNHQTGCRHPHR